jgi:hypothetical protein
MPTKFIGPWSGGLNLISNRDLSPFLGQHDLGEATNVNYTPEGFLEPRPGCRVFTDDTWDSNLYAYIDDADNSVFHLVGWVDAGDDGIFAYVTVLENGIEHLYRINSSGNSFELHSTNDPVGFTHLINHHGFVADVNLDTNPDHAGTDYFYPKDTGIIFFTSTFNTAYITPDVTSLSFSRVDQKLQIPASDMGMVVKDRLFLFNKKASKMYYSPPGYILDFRVLNELNPPSEPISIAAPFGEDTSGEEPIEPSTDADDIIRCVEFQNNNFYIFKRNSTFLFTYQNSPITDGYMRKISDRMGAFDSTIYKENIIIINNKGVYRIDGTNFLDLQEKMNFRFEIPIDHTGVKPDNIFITNFNDTILFGMLDTVSDPEGQPSYYYYAMNGNTGAWSRWDYDYAPNIAKPGSDYILCCPSNSVKIKMLYTTFDKKRIVFMDWKPSYDNFDYHLDSNTNHTDTLDELYFPSVSIKTTASFGDSMLKYKKLYRYYIRLYLSDNPAPSPEYPVWTLSLNYNQYQFNAKHNPKFYLYPSVQENFPGTKTEFGVDSMSIQSALYKRTYQVALPQQRVTEFLFELSRRYTTLPVGLSVQNLEANRPINTGYYFLLSGFWFDYENKAGI